MILSYGFQEYEDYVPNIGGEDTILEPSRILCNYPECNKSYATLRGLKTHIKRKHEGKRYECPFQDCKKLLASKHSLQRHCEKCHGNSHSGNYNVIVHVAVDEPISESMKDQFIKRQKQQISDLSQKLQTILKEVNSLRKQVKIKTRIVNRIKSGAIVAKNLK